MPTMIQIRQVVSILVVQPQDIIFAWKFSHFMKIKEAINHFLLFH